MINSAVKSFLLRKLPFDCFAFPRWQSVLAITLIGMLMGLDPAMRAGTPDMPGMALFVSIPMAVFMVWILFLLIVGILKWWMKRGGRWDGQGDLFNLVAASWLVADVLGGGLAALGMPSLPILLLGLYSVWVGGNALSSAIPKASLGYSIGGIVIGLIPVIFAMGLIMGLAGTLGVAPPVAG